MTSIASPQEYAGGLAAGIRIASIIQAQVNMQLADMSSIRQYCTYLGDISGSGSDTITARYSDLGAKTPLVNIADGTDLTPAAMDGSTAVCSVARSGLAFEISDLFSMTGLGSDINPFTIASSMTLSAEARINEIICATFDNATASTGTSGVDLALDDWLDALYTLEEANNGGGITCCLKQKQFTDLQRALRSENNNFLAFSASTEDMSASKPQGLAGSLLGVQIFRSDFVQQDVSTNNWVGLMWGDNGVGWASGSPQIVGASSQFRQAGSYVIVEFDRNSLGGLSRIVAHLYCGAVLLEQDRVVKIVTSK